MKQIRVNVAVKLHDKFFERESDLKRLFFPLPSQRDGPRPYRVTAHTSPTPIADFDVEARH